MNVCLHYAKKNGKNYQSLQDYQTLYALNKEEFHSLVIFL